ncbi:alpha/beta fold hydrolase [Streptomyces sp. NPDC091217]|uniref:alpha/beta fold hydrolase n=1 Tax=Streptomyces sp. NPDC091217 TaxID=3365975 RepID=UPI0037F88E74
MAETFVLITGAWHGGWAWRSVAQHLRTAGHRVFAPTLPGLRDGDDATAYHLNDVVDSVVDLIETNDLRDVTAVAHSWGGFVLGGAAPRIADRLRKMVYLSAFVPQGRALIDEAPVHLGERFSAIAAATPDNTLLIPFEVWQNLFMQDASEDAQRIVYSLLVPQPMQYITEPVPAMDQAALSVPSTYLVGADDITLTPEEFERYAARLGVRPTSVPGSHEMLFTQPAELAKRLIAEASGLTAASPQA